MEEKKEQGQYSILNYETNISVQFYIPKEWFVLKSEGTLLPIPTIGIKHSRLLSYKLFLHSEV